MRNAHLYTLALVVCLVACNKGESSTLGSNPGGSTSATQQKADSVGSGGWGGTFSEGFRMGKITKASAKWIVMDSCEAQMLMGRKSTPYMKVTGSGENRTEKRVNPWHFSGAKERCGELGPHLGKYVWVRYNQARIKAPNRDTDYVFADVQRVTRKAPSQTVCEEHDAKGSKSKGVRIGRIVKASQKGHAAKTWELILQQGEEGAQFKNMSVRSAAMFDCAVSFLKSGKPVRVHYKEAIVRNPLAQDTGYDIAKIELEVEDEL